MSYFDDHEDEIIYGRPWLLRHGDEPQKVECRQCGEGSLEWNETKKGWRLFDSDGNEHTCNEGRVHRAVSDDFEDCT